MLQILYGSGSTTNEMSADGLCLNTLLFLLCPGFLICKIGVGPISEDKS